MVISRSCTRLPGISYLSHCKGAPSHFAGPQGRRTGWEADSRCIPHPLLRKEWGTRSRTSGAAEGGGVCPWRTPDKLDSLAKTPNRQKKRAWQYRQRGQNRSKRGFYGRIKLRHGLWVDPPFGRIDPESVPHCYTPRCCLIQSVVTDFGRVIGVPMARLRIIWAHIPTARETPKMAV